MALSETDGETKDVLAVSTEDGRILFYDTTDIVEPQPVEPDIKPEIPVVDATCQLGGSAEGLTGRVKDFEILKLSGPEDYAIITGSSDGAVRLWTVRESELVDDSSISRDTNGEASIPASSDDGKANGNASKLSATRQVGSLLGTYEAGNRITCLKAFVMSEAESLIEPNRGSENGNTGKNRQEPDSDADNGTK